MEDTLHEFAEQIYFIRINIQLNRRLNCILFFVKYNTVVATNYFMGLCAQNNQVDIV
jgi:hypothetical protein